MTIGGSSAIDGYRAAEASLAARGDRIARATEVAAASPQPQAAARTDITSDVVGLSTDRLAGTYDLKAQKVRDRMLGEVLDILK